MRLIRADLFVDIAFAGDQRVAPAQHIGAAHAGIEEREEALKWRRATDGIGGLQLVPRCGVADAQHMRQAVEVLKLQQAFFGGGAEVAVNGAV